jgi:hypothetical protein
MASSGFVAALEAQSERTQLLDKLYGRLNDPHTAEAERHVRNFSQGEDKHSRRLRRSVADSTSKPRH